MKTRFYTLLTVAVILFAFTACEDKDEDKTVTVTIGAQANTTIDGFYAVGENVTYNMADGCKDSLLVDVFCFYEAETGNNIALASPGSGITGIFTGNDAPETWLHQNTTKFYLTTLTVANFDAVQENDDLLISSYNDVDARRKAKDVQVDDIWSFKTEDGYYGLLKITAVTQGADGSVSFEIKKMLATGK